MGLWVLLAVEGFRLGQVFVGDAAFLGRGLQQPQWDTSRAFVVPQGVVAAASTCGEVG